MKDDIYATPLDWVENFTFDSSVASVFQDMITRSVPGYRTTLAMIGVITSRMVQPHSRIYDLGCSLGAGSLIAANARPDIPYEVIAVDTSQPMLERCEQEIRNHPPANKIRLHHEDIRESKIHNASVVILNFTLQFIPVADRLPLLQAIWQGLNPGGVLILSEKIHFEDPRKETLLYQLHHDFKRRNGYSDLEISQKRSALEKTLITETLATHRDRLQQAGFSQVCTWFQCFNFTSLIGLKT